HTVAGGQGALCQALKSVRPSRSRANRMTSPRTWGVNTYATPVTVTVRTPSMAGTVGSTPLSLGPADANGQVRSDQHQIRHQRQQDDQPNGRHQKGHRQDGRSSRQGQVITQEPGGT